MNTIRKFSSGAILQDPILGSRQIRVIASDPTPDRVKDVMVPEGCKLDNYRKNPVVLADHNSSMPIGRANVEVANGRVEALIDFAPQGISAKADEYCGLAKAGVLNAVSIGFNPIAEEPIKEGGYRYKEWELMELSLVAVPANPAALVIGRSAKADAAAWKCGASRNLPLSDKDSWDGPGAEARIFEHAKFDGDSPDTVWARKAFLAYDSAAPKLRGSYKLPFADVVDGRLTAIAGGLHAAASRLSGTDIPDDVKEKGQAVLDHYKSQRGDDDAGDDDGKSAQSQEEIVDLEIKVLEAAAQLGKAGRVNAENAAALDRAMKCMESAKVRVEKCAGHVKAAHEHIAEARGHMQAIQDRIKPPPGDSDDDGDGGDQEKPDVELARSVDRIKRLVAALALAAAP